MRWQCVSPTSFMHWQGETVQCKSGEFLAQKISLALNNATEPVLVIPARFSLQDAGILRSRKPLAARRIGAEEAPAPAIDDASVAQRDARVATRVATLWPPVRGATRCATKVASITLLIHPATKHKCRLWSRGGDGIHWQRAARHSASGKI
jgi:hypothetical protein